LRVSGSEVVPPILTTWRRPDRKSSIQLHMVECSWMNKADEKVI